MQPYSYLPSMDNRQYFLALAVMISIFFSSCKKDSNLPQDQPLPAVYDGSNFDANTRFEAGILGRLRAITDTLKKGRVSTNRISFQSLTALFSDGNPGLSSLSTVYYRDRISGAGGWLADAASASGNLYTPKAPSSDDKGGVYGGYLFDKYGLEPEQLIEKGMFGSVLFHRANLLLRDSLSMATSDRVIAITGSNPGFPNTSNPAKSNRPDAFFAVYIARRDKNDGSGFYTELKKNYTKLQAALSRNPVAESDLRNAREAILLNLEMVNAATIINYCHTTISLMSKTNPSDSDKANALHALSEAIGFLHGYRLLNPGFTRISTEQIDQNLERMNAPVNGQPACYLFVTTPETQLPKLAGVIADLKAIYGFTNQQIEDFRKNWISEQGR